MSCPCTEEEPYSPFLTHEWDDGEWEGRHAGVVLFTCIKCGVGKYCEVQDPDYRGVMVSA
jgi:hypothetical protein